MHISGFTWRYAIYCGGNLEIKGGTLSINTTEDGIIASRIIVTGTIGDITAGGCGIYGFEAIDINGTVGDINITASGRGGIVVDGEGGEYVKISESGQVGNISSPNMGVGIGAFGEYAYVDISGTVGNVTGNTEGIFASTNVNISGTVGDVTATDASENDGIYGEKGYVIVSGKVNSISADRLVYADTYYAVLDYKASPGALITPANCDPSTAHNVNFVYLGVTPTANDVKYAWVTDGTLLPMPSFGKTEWYTDETLETPYVFSTPVAANMTLYTGIVGGDPVSDDTSGDTGGGTGGSQSGGGSSRNNPSQDGSPHPDDLDDVPKTGDASAALAHIDLGLGAVIAVLSVLVVLTVILFLVYTRKMWSERK